MHHPEQAKMLKRQVYTNDLMGKVHTTKVHAKFKMPTKGPTRLPHIPKDGTDADFANARAILQKLSTQQLDAILAELSIAMPQCSPSAVAATATSHPLMGTQATAMDYFDEHLAIEIRQHVSRPLMSMRSRPMISWEESMVSIFLMMMSLQMKRSET